MSAGPLTALAVCGYSTTLLPLSHRGKFPFREFVRNAGNAKFTCRRRFEEKFECKSMGVLGRVPMRKVLLEVGEILRYSHAAAV
jgi:hypothetical protein